MAQQFLDAAKVGAMFQKVGGEAVTQSMPVCDPAGGGQVQPESFHQPLHVAYAKPNSVEADKKRPASIWLRQSESQAVPFFDILCNRP